MSKTVLLSHKKYVLIKKDIKIHMEIEINYLFIYYKLLASKNLPAPWEYNSQDRVPVKPLTGTLYAGGTRRKSSLEYVPYLMFCYDIHNKVINIF